MLPKGLHLLGSKCVRNVQCKFPSMLPLKYRKSCANWLVEVPASSGSGFSVFEIVGEHDLVVCVSKNIFLPKSGARR